MTEPVGELMIQLPDGAARTYRLGNASISLGRAPTNDLSFPEDSILSRNHLRFERDAGCWWAVDLGSKNGTLLNGGKLTGRQMLRPGDVISAGRLAIQCQAAASASSQPAVFYESAEDTASTGATVVIRLNQAFGSKPGTVESALDPASAAGRRRTEALIRAGRELVSHRPLGELFQVILQLATETVGARRGLLITVEDGQLCVRAQQGEGFRISTAVRDKVLNERASLLVQDAGLDELLRSSKTIVEQRVRSLMAVPLQTDEAVIGLIYVDTMEILHPFVQEDLSLLTVLANTAAIRIEHARLAEVEQAERLMAKEIEQAAEIQRNLLPASAPEVPGLDIAGHSVPCRAVGGDYFDYLTLPDGRTGLLVADVAGKGMPASLLMASVHSRVRILAELESDPGEFLSRLNRSIYPDFPRNRFITLFLAAYEEESGELSYACAGHNPPFVLRAGGTRESLDGGGPPVGMFRISYQSHRLSLDVGDTLVIYSDGVPEGHNAQDEEFGEERLIEAILSREDSTAASAVSAVRTAMADFVLDRPASDDITLLVAHRTA
jgi:serine phosphatase RsbU (regulator of sigma subunit)